MGSLSKLVRQHLPHKVFNDGKEDRYIITDFDIPPKPEALVAMGIAATVEQAVALIQTDRSLWGGSRNHVSLGHMEELFGDQFPATVPFGAKPVVHSKLVAANVRKMAVDGEILDTDMGFAAVFSEWKELGVIQ